MGAWFGNQREKRGLRDSEGLAFTDGWEQAVGYGGEFGPGGVGVNKLYILLSISDHKPIQLSTMGDVGGGWEFGFVELGLYECC